MKRLAEAAALALALVLLVPEIVRADYVTDALEVLKDSRVYVAPNTEGTDRNTASNLQTHLQNDDNIVLVMLPATAEEELGADIDTIARRLSEELKDARIIGLAVGDKVVGYAPGLPTGVAADLMRRADSVSNDPVTALGTFARNVHIWQSENPEPEPPLISNPTDGSSFWWILISVAGGGFALLVFLLLIFGSPTSTPKEKTRFDAPDPVKGLINQIVRLREGIADYELRASLLALCKDLEFYFKAASNNKKRDTEFFKARLGQVISVLQKYVDVQDNPRYYHSANKELQKGKEAIIDFTEYVLESTRRGKSADLFDYNVHTDILQAQRYRR